MPHLGFVSIMLLPLALSPCVQSQPPVVDEYPNVTLVEYRPADVTPLRLEVAPGGQRGFNLIAAGDLERTPRDYVRATARVKSAGSARVTLALIDILDREHRGQQVDLQTDVEADISVDAAQVGRPISMLRTVRVHVEGQPVQVLDLRISCAVEMLPKPDVVVQGPMDHTSIQAALDSLPEQGGVVCIPAGTYAFTHQVTIPHDNVTIYGDGRDTILQGTWYEPKALLRAENRQNLRITRLHLRGLPITEFRGYNSEAHARVPEDVGRPTVTSRGIELRNCTNVRVDRCQIQLFGHAGVIFYGGTGNLADHCYLHENFRYGLGYGVATPGTTQLHIEDNNFENHRHGIAGNAGGASYIARFNRLVKYADVFPSWNQEPYKDGRGGERPGINHLRNFEIDAHAGCGWIYAHDNFVAMYGAVQMVRAAQMRGNPGWVYRNVFENCAVGVGASGDSDDVWTWDNVLRDVGEPYLSTASGSIHFDQKPPNFREIPYPHALNRLGWWPGADEDKITIVRPETQFAGPTEAAVLVPVGTAH